MLDWYDGRIEETYAIPCYQQAIDHLPSDLEIYSSAREDILHALAIAVAQQNRGPASTTSTTSSVVEMSTTVDEPAPPPLASGTNGSESLPLPFLILGGLALFLLATGAAGMTWRRLQRGRRMRGD